MRPMREEGAVGDEVRFARVAVDALVATEARRVQHETRGNTIEAWQQQLAAEIGTALAPRYGSSAAEIAAEALAHAYETDDPMAFLTELKAGAVALDAVEVGDAT